MYCYVNRELVAVQCDDELHLWQYLRQSFLQDDYLRVTWRDLNNPDDVTTCYEGQFGDVIVAELSAVFASLMQDQYVRFECLGKNPVVVYMAEDDDHLWEYYLP